MTEIEKSIIQRVKEKLNLNEDINVFQLHELLYKTRNNSHPDLYDENLKDEATKKFSELNQLLAELKIHIDNLKLNENSNQLILYKENYENILHKSQIIQLEEKVINLKRVVNQKSEEINKLKEQIECFQSEELKKIENDLKELYRPKKNNLVVLGITATLIILINLLVQITSLKENFNNAFPFRIEFINIILLMLFIFVIINILFKNYHLNRIKKIGEELKTNSKIQTFLNVYVDYGERDYSYDLTKNKFTESQVERFINNSYLNKKNKFKINILDIIIEAILFPNKAKNINYLKDIFIYNLINKDLIKIGNSKQLDREFYIK